MKRMSIFIGQPIYSLKDICLGGGTVEKSVIFEGQEDVLLKRGAWKAKSESSTASIQRLSPIGMPFLTFIEQQRSFNYDFGVIHLPFGARVFVVQMAICGTKTHLANIKN